MKFDLNTQNLDFIIIKIKQKIIDLSIVPDKWSGKTAKIISIDIEGFDDHCNRCDALLNKDNVYKYCGYTRCLSCKSDDDDFDDEMS